MTLLQRYSHLLAPGGDCLIWIGALNNGVPKIKGGKNPQRLIFSEHTGLPLYPNVPIAPICGKKHCCNPEHLAMGRHAKHRAKRIPEPEAPPKIETTEGAEECLDALQDGSIRKWRDKTDQELLDLLAEAGFDTTISEIQQARELDGR